MSEVRAPDAKPASFLRHAKLIGGLTLLSRFFGLGREIVAGHYLGTALVGSAFTVAFVIPNLFRKLFGEGALSAAFIPLYAKAVKAEQLGSIPKTEPSGSAAGSPVAGEFSDVTPLLGSKDPAAEPLGSVVRAVPAVIAYDSGVGQSAADFAAAAVNLLVLMLIGLTVIGEIVLLVLIHFDKSFAPDRILMLKLTAIMLPYVLLICSGAFLSGILQVHSKFGPPAAAPIILNACHILVLLVGASMIGLNRFTPIANVVPKQTHLAYWLAGSVLVAGCLQLLVLFPTLKQVGFRFRIIPHFWTPAVRRMLALSMPVAIGAGVLQLSVLLDKGISWFLMRDVDAAGHAIGTFHLLGKVVPLPMVLGAPRRLDLAQFLYQFPLGIFAIALATAIFPGLSADALEKDRDRFRVSLRHGIEASLWEGLPASVGLMLVAVPTARLMFQHGQITFDDATLIAKSTAIYAGAIWAFSLLQIVNRAYYAVHDTVTPLVMSVVNIVINLVVEIPLLWVMGESGMAVGTVASFAIQAVMMLYMLDRKVGGLNLKRTVKPVAKMLIATAAMTAACLALHALPIYPKSVNRTAWAVQLVSTLITGAGVYLIVCRLLGVTTMNELMPKRRKRKVGPSPSPDAIGSTLAGPGSPADVSSENLG